MIKSTHRWLVVKVAGDDKNKHAVCKRCHAERKIELRPRHIRYRTKDLSVWVAKAPACVL